MTLASPARGYPLERIVGNVGAMSLWVDQFDVVAVHLGELRGALARATGLSDVGKAIAAVRTEATGALATIGPDVALAQQLSRVLSAYARAHDEHATKANALVEEIETAHAVWAVRDAAADEAGRGALAASRGDDKAALHEAEDAAADAIAARRRAEEDLDDLWRRYEFHYGEWDHAYDTAVRALVLDASAPPTTVESAALIDDLLAADTAAEALALWLAHPELHEELLGAHPAILGGMDGLPAAVRVRANRLNAAEWIRQAQAELDGEFVSAARRAFIEDELAYLRLVQDGTVKLYLYDRAHSRIVEIVGDLDAPPTRVLTYVPGTFTNLGDFYGGKVQQVAVSMTEKVPGTVAFVYKDGVFPGENPDVGGIYMPRIREANEHDRARDAGAQLARFEVGMRTDPLFAGTEQDAFGHSWGLANVTSSEVAGAEYDKVISLAGAGMLPEWVPDPDTTYADLSYKDALQVAQETGLVWNGNNPRSNPAFEHGDYYRGPDDVVLDRAEAATIDGSPHMYLRPEYFSVLVDNHDLIASEKPANRKALDAMKELLGK